jgi:hypothetical protein
MRISMMITICYIVCLGCVDSDDNYRENLLRPSLPFQQRDWKQRSNQNKFSFGIDFAVKALTLLCAYQ